MSYVYNLIIAVLKQAMRDYMVALLKKDFAKIAKLEKFFLSEYGQAMSYNNGERIIRWCKDKVNKKRKQIKNETLNRDNGNTPKSD